MVFYNKVCMKSFTTRVSVGVKDFFMYIFFSHIHILMIMGKGKMLGVIKKKKCTYRSCYGRVIATFYDYFI